MSLIIAKRENDRVVMMADSCTSGTSFRDTLTNKVNCKIVVIGDTLVASSGRVACVDVLINHEEWFDTMGEELDKKFIVTNIIPKYQRELKERGLIVTSKDGAPMPEADSSHLIAHKDKLYQIYGDFSVREVDRRTFIGCTRTVAFAWLEDDCSDETMLEALRVSSRVDECVAPPFIRVDTVNKTVEVLED